MTLYDKIMKVIHEEKNEKLTEVFDEVTDVQLTILSAMVEGMGHDEKIQTLTQVTQAVQTFLEKNTLEITKIENTTLH